MKKLLTVLLFILLAAFAFSAAALAETPEQTAPDLTLTPLFDTDEAVKLWQPVCFEVRSETIRNESVKFLFNLGNEPDYDEPWTEPLWIWINDEGCGEAWFTPGTVDVFIFDYEELYKDAHTGYMYTAYVQAQDDDAHVSNPVTFTTVMDEKDPLPFTPTVTDVNSGSVAQDDVFRAVVSNVGDFEHVCLVVFDSEGKYAADSHWVYVPDVGQDNILLEAPLVACPVNGEYTAKVYGLTPGYPICYSDLEWTFRVTSPADLGGSDIVIGGLKDSYVTGEGVHPSVYYPNTEGLDNIVLDVGFYYADEPWFEQNPDSWNLNYTVWPEPDGSLHFFPQEDWQKPQCWIGGRYKYVASVWQTDENGERILLDRTERFFTATSEGPLDLVPEFPEYIDASAMPYTLALPDMSGIEGWWYLRIENRDDHDWDADPEWNNLIAEFNSDDPAGIPESIEIDGVNQRIYIHIEAGQYNYDIFHLDRIIPVVKLGGRVSLRTEDWVTENTLPIHVNIPLWVEADGADWLRLENDDGEFDFRGDPQEIARGIESNTNINRDGPNYIIATAGFGDTEEQAILTVQGYVEGNAGPLTATLEKTEVTRGEPVTVSFTKSENADHYWVDLDIWNEEWNDWEWREHLADLNVDGENVGGEAVMNTFTLEPNTYRVRALAEGAGFNTSEYVITESFTVHEVSIPDSGLLLDVSKTDVETCEEFEVSALAPGANWMEIYWNMGEDDWGWRNHSEGRNAFTWRQSYGNSGDYRIMVRAFFDEYDENGDPIWEIDEETGEIHTDENGNPDWRKQRIVEEYIDVCVTAPNGELYPIAAEGIPETLTANDGEQTISFTVEKPENAVWIEAEAFLENVDDGGLYWNQTEEDILHVSFDLTPEIGQSVNIRVRAKAPGYEMTDQEYRIPVLPGDEASDMGYITVDEGGYYFDDQGLCHVPVHGHVRFVVQAKDGHTLTAVKFFGTHGWWENGEEISHDNHHDWFNGDGSAFFHEDIHDDNWIGKTVYVYALVRVDGEEDYYLTEAFPVFVEDYFVGPYDFASLEPVTVEYGKNAVFTFTESEGANEYWVDAWDIDDPDSNCNPDTSFSGTTVTMSTAQLYPGEFIIRGRAGTREFGDMREAESDLRLIVTPSDVSYGSVVLTVDKDEALTCEDVHVDFFAPGADYVKLLWVNENGNENDFRWRNSAGVSGQFSENWPQTVEIIGEAHYFVRDENGELVPDGDKTDEEGNTIWKEYEPVRSAPHPVKFTAPNGKIPQDASAIPVTAEAGKDLHLVMPAPETGSMDWEIYLNRDFDDDRQEPDVRSDGEPLDLTIPASQVVLGNTIELRVWTDGLGYEHNHRDYRIPVTGGSESRVTVSVDKAVVQTNEDFTVTVSAPDADYIQFFDGYGFWKHWDDEAQQDVIENIGLDENGQWHVTENHGNSDTLTIYARAMINGKWVTGDPVRVTVNSVGRAEDLPVWLERKTVTRGETAVIRYGEPAEHSDEESYSLNHYRFREEGEEDIPYDIPNWALDTDTRALRFSTVGMSAGEYRLRIWVRGEPGYDGRETRELSLFVTEPEPGEVSLDIANPNVPTNEAVRFNAYAAGADRIEIFWRLNDDSWNGDGEYFTGMYNYNQAGTYQVFARAYYDQGEGEEPVTVDSDPITVTVASNGQLFPMDVSGLPTYFIAGQDAYLYCGRSEDATYMGWEIYLNWDGYWDQPDGPDYRQEQNEDLCLTIPGSELVAGTTVQVRIWSSAVGYEHHHINLNIPVLSPNAEGLTIGADKANVVTCEDLEVTVGFPAGTYSEIQFFNGRDYWQQQDLDSITDSQTWGLSFDQAGTYSLHARLWNARTETWDYTGTVAVEVSAPYGYLTFDTSSIPTTIIEGDDASFTLIPPAEATNWNYELRDETNDEKLISWDTPKTSLLIEIPSNKIIDGHRYRLDLNASAPGYDSSATNIGLDIMGASRLTLSVDKKYPSYGETVNFTLNDPNADDVIFYLVKDGGTRREKLQSLTWIADRTGPVSFEVFDTNSGLYSNTVTVNVLTLGEAPVAGLEVTSEALSCGGTLSADIVPPEGGWASVSIYDSGEDPVETWDNLTEPYTVSISNVHVGAYQIYVVYGKDGYDAGMIEAEVQVSHLYGAVWTWDENGEAPVATLTLRCICGETVGPLEAQMTRETIQEPTCEENGNESWTATVEFNGQSYDDIRYYPISETGHDWGKPVFTWDDSGETPTATATFTCRNNGGHTRTEDAQVDKTGHEDATCTEPASDLWIAECEGYTDEHKVPTGSPAGHSGEWRVFWNDDYTAYAERECEVCGEVEHANLLTGSEVVKPATCEARGELLWTASPMLGGPDVSATKKQYTPKADHTPGEPAYTEDGLEIIRCSVCGAILSCEYPHDEHAWSEPVYTWLEGNYMSATRTCTATPDHPHTESETVRITETIAQSPTETEEGIVIHAACFTKECFETQEETMHIPAFGDANVLRLPAALTVIESEAFAGTNAQEIIVPDGVTFIASDAFAGCDSLIYISLPADTVIEGGAFTGLTLDVVVDRR